MKKIIGKNSIIKTLKSTFTIFIMVFAIISMQSCKDSNDEPEIPTSKEEVTIVAMSGNTLKSINTADKQVKTTTVDDSYGVLKCLFLHNGEMMLFSKASDGYRMMKFDGDKITDNNIVSILNDYIADPWWVSLSYANNSYCYNCCNYSTHKYVIIDENGNSKEYSYKYDNGEAPFIQYSNMMVDGYGNFYQTYKYSLKDDPSGNCIVEKNSQILFQVSGFQAPIKLNVVGNDVYLLGSNNDGKGVYAVNSKVVVDDHFSAISCACVINDQLCLGGYRTDEHKVKRATMKVGEKYYDLTDELGWYEHKDETGSGNNHSSNVEHFMVENNEIFAIVRKYTQVDPWIAGGYDYFIESGDAIFRNTYKVMDMGDKLIHSCVVITQKK